MTSDTECQYSELDDDNDESDEDQSSEDGEEARFSPSYEAPKKLSYKTSTTSLDPNARKKDQGETDAADAATSKGTECQLIYVFGFPSD